MEGFGGLCNIGILLYIIYYVVIFGFIGLEYLFFKYVLKKKYTEQSDNGIGLLFFGIIFIILSKILFHNYLIFELLYVGFFLIILLFLSIPILYFFNDKILYVIYFVIYYILGICFFINDDFVFFGGMYCVLFLILIPLIYREFNNSKSIFWKIVFTIILLPSIVIIFKLTGLISSYLVLSLFFAFLFLKGEIDKDKSYKYNLFKIIGLTGIIILSYLIFLHNGVEYQNNYFLYFSQDSIFILTFIILFYPIFVLIISIIIFIMYFYYSILCIEEKNYTAFMIGALPILIIAKDIYDAGNWSVGNSILIFVFYLIFLGLYFVYNGVKKKNNYYIVLGALIILLLPILWHYLPNIKNTCVWNILSNFFDPKNNILNSIR